MTDSILRAVVDRLRANGATAATVERVTVGDGVVMVELLADGTAGDDPPRRLAGLAHRPPGPVPSATDRDVETLLEWATGAVGPSPDGREDRDHGAIAVGVAALNALSAPFVDWQRGDPMALLESDVETITTVGLFRPAFRKFDDVEVRVIERDPVDPASVSAPDGVAVSTFEPGEAEVAMDGASVVFVTGSAFVYGGVERYLEAAPASATVVLVGATASVLPGPAFDVGVDIVAGAAVVEPDRVREAIRQGACGTDLHDAGVAKVYAVDGRPRGVRLDATDDRSADRRDERTATDRSRRPEDTNP
ncbi:Rossmann-like domain-containing protein [Natronobeatus ordinarius]|uniref:Rossmann-like domain-containing protein n=1 Tax=Natronobeatus ordinarius TaxID=2963433 RepID=UPI0020CBFDBC|nr:DUF364 domain-containing protein [Natronobeatus ordinarius]